MRRSTLDILRCPACRSRLALVTDEAGEDVETGSLALRGMRRRLSDQGRDRPLRARRQLRAEFRRPVEHVPQDPAGQLTAAKPISRDRFKPLHRLDRGRAEGSAGARCRLRRRPLRRSRARRSARRSSPSIISTAVDAARANLLGQGRHRFHPGRHQRPAVRGRHLPLGLLPGRHPAHARAGRGKLRQARGDDLRRAAGWRSMSMPAGWKNLFFAKYWIRPLTRRMSAERSYRNRRKDLPAALCGEPIGRPNPAARPLSALSHSGREL